MELRHINYFLVLADELHFGRAATRLHISQPPLTRAIQQLEHEVGAMLFERNKRNVMLTAAGLELLADARRMMTHLDGVKRKLKTFGSGQVGLIRIGYVGAVMHTKLPAVLKQFSAVAPEVTVALEEQSNESLLQGLHNRTIDVAFVRTWMNARELREDVIYTEPLVLVVSKLSPLARKKSISMDALANETFITFSRDCGPTIFDQFIFLCAQAGFSPRITHHSSQLNSVLRLVEAGFGVSLLPASTVGGYALNLKFLPIEQARNEIPLLMLSRPTQASEPLEQLRRHMLTKSASWRVER